MGRNKPVVSVVDLKSPIRGIVRGNGVDVTRDEVSGPVVPAPAEARPGVPGTGDSAGEGGAVRTAVRENGPADAPEAGGASDTRASDTPDTAPGESADLVEEGSSAESDADPAGSLSAAAGTEAPAAAASSRDADDAAGGDATSSGMATDTDHAVAETARDDSADGTGGTDRADGADAERTVVTGLPAAGAPDPGATTVTALPTGVPAPDGSRSAAPRGAGFHEVTSTYVVQDAPAEMSPSELRVDFGAHLEANYQRLVAQLYAITLNPDQAHSVVQDAYSRAWRNWAVIGRSADPTGWVRRVAVRTTMRSWRHVLARFGLARPAPPVAEGLDERTTALLNALRELPAAERRSVVLFHMAGLSTGEIAAVEQVSPTTISTRLDRARRVVMGDTSDMLTGVIELPGVVLDDDRGYVDEMSMPLAEERPAPVAAHLDDRWERADTWNGGPDGSWPVSEAPPWDAPNSDPWPGAGSARPAWQVPGDDQVTTLVTGANAGNDLPPAGDDRTWDGRPAHDGGALIDDFDTVAPDGTTVSTADIAFGSSSDEVRGEAAASSRESGEVAGADGGSADGTGSVSDSEDRR